MPTVAFPQETIFCRADEDSEMKNWSCFESISQKLRGLDGVNFTLGVKSKVKT